MKTLISNHKKILLTSLIGLILIAATAIIFAVSQPKLSAGEPAWQDLTEGALKVGKYYVDGDTSQYYLEVTEDGTIQLKGVDYYEYSAYGNDQAPEEMIQEYAEKYATAYKYLVAHFPNWDEFSTFIFTEYTINEVGGISGTGYLYVDENTILRSGKENAEIFIYKDENSPQTFSAPDKITRIVDAVFPEE